MKNSMKIVIGVVAVALIGGAVYFSNTKLQQGSSYRLAQTQQQKEMVSGFKPRLLIPGTLVASSADNPIASTIVLAGNQAEPFAKYKITSTKEAFTIRNVDLYINDSDLDLQRTVIQNNNDYGIKFYQSSSVQITNSLIHNNFHLALHLLN